MLKARLEAADAVRSTFLPTEQAQDEAAIRAARCLATALEARAQANLPLGTGLAAIAHLSQGAALAVQARQSFIEAHRALAALPHEVGLDVVGWGDGQGCPPIDASAPAVLKAVA